MKKLLITFTLLATALIVWAGTDSATLSVQSKIGTTNTTTDVRDLSGYLHAIDFNITDGVVNTGNCTVTIWTGNMVLFTGVVKTAGIKYPRYPVQNFAGTTVNSSSNAWERAVLCQDKVSIRAADTASVTNTINARLIFIDN